MKTTHQTEITLSRKMQSLQVLLLFVATTLGNENRNHNRLPVDYFDDDFQSNLKVGPDSTFTFNFEQVRRDQPPQIEMREENVGRYLHTRSQTTTHASIFSKKADKESQHVYPTMISANNYHHEQGHWNEPQGSSVPPPPKFAFSRPHNNEPNLKKNSLPTWNSPAVRQNAHPSNSNRNSPPQVIIPKTQEISSTPASHPVQSSEPPKPQSISSPHVASSHQTAEEGVYFAPSASYISDSITNTVPHQPPSLSNRGHHKFRWNDIKENPIVSNQPLQTSGTLQSIQNKPPPPVPTLSPWYDNFGK